MYLVPRSGISDTICYQSIIITVIRVRDPQLGFFFFVKVRRKMQAHFFITVSGPSYLRFVTLTVFVVSIQGSRYLANCGLVG